MEFLHQLRLLLWKNLMLKKRKWWALLIEVFIPLVMFVILIFIRRHVPKRAVDMRRSETRVLPSSGVIRVIQSFCAGYSLDDDQFLLYRQDKHVYQLLDRLQAAGRHAPFFQQPLSTDSIDRIPKYYHSLVSDPASLHNDALRLRNISLDDLLVSKSERFQRIMSILAGQTVVHSSPSPSPPLYPSPPLSSSSSSSSSSSPFGQLPVMPVKSPAPLSDWTLSRKKRSVIQSVTLASIYSANLLSRRQFQNGAYTQVELDQPSRPPPWTISGALSSILFKPSPLAGDRWDNASRLLASSMFEDFRPSDSRLDDIFNGLLNLSYNEDFDLKEGNSTAIVEMLIDLLTSPAGLNVLFCDAHLSISDAEQMGFTADRLCDLAKSHPALLGAIVRSLVNETAVVQIFQLDKVNLTATAERVRTFVSDLKIFTTLDTALTNIVHFAQLFPLDSCEPAYTANSNGTASASRQRFNATTTPNVAGTGRVGDDKSKKGGDDSELSRMAKIWSLLQTTLCGFNSTEDKMKYERTGSSGGYDEYGLQSWQRSKFKILLPLMFRNPRVLFAPNASAVLQVIQRANASIHFLSTLSGYVRRWHNVSTQLRFFMESVEFQHDLDALRQIQAELRRPSLFSGLLLRFAPDLRVFRDNASISTADDHLSQLDTIDRVACSWDSVFRDSSLDLFKGFRTEEELVNYNLQQAYTDNATVIAGLIFKGVRPNDTEMPRHVVYKIRQNASLVPNTRRIRDRFWSPSPRSYDYFYYTFGFVWIQDMVERALIDNVMNEDVVEPGTYVQQQPYPCYLYDLFFVTCKHLLPICIVLSWVYPVAMLVQNIVSEKEMRVKVVMKTMGLESSVHWMAWFTTSFSQMTMTVTILTLMLRFGNVLPYADMLLIFITLELFAISSILFSFLISVLFSKAKLAAASAGILYFLTYVPCLYVSIRETTTGKNITSFAKLIISFFSTSAFGLGAKYIAFYEEEAVGVSWDNFHLSPVEGDSYSLLQVLGMLVADSILYGMLSWYIENVHPGSYGLPRPWYFPFTSAYWKGYANVSGSDRYSLFCVDSWRHLLHRLGVGAGLSVREDDQQLLLSQPSIAGKQTADCQSRNHWVEAEPARLTKGVVMSNLTKRYHKKDRLALKNFNLTLYENQITALLGHNGAGKTTTMSILSGLFPSSAGSVEIYGLKMGVDTELIRKQLGMCPQHNVLFDKLTVLEHLWFYGSLKSSGSRTKRQLFDEIAQMIEDVRLVDKKHAKVECLSGGMKRLLSVAIAFIGGSRTVVLDEPTAGVDPSARRAIWDLLIKYRQGRTILLSTHHLDEADIIGDRIAIISEGELVCCGSAVFLKKLFGDGYHLTVVKRSGDDELPLDISEDSSSSTDDSGLTDISGSKGVCDPEKILRLLRQHCADAYLKTETHWEFEFILPFSSCKHFLTLFDALERDSAALAIDSFGLRDTALEEVFLKVTTQALSARASSESPTYSHSTANIPMNSLNCSNAATSTSTAAVPQTISASQASAPQASASQASAPRASAPQTSAPRASAPQTSAPAFRAVSEIVFEPISFDVIGEGNYFYMTLFMAIMTKRFQYIHRNWKAVASQIVLPSVFVCIAMTVALAAPRAEDMPALVLSPAQYFNLTQPLGNFIPVNLHDTVPSQQRFPNGEAGPPLLNGSLYLPSGVGATCLLKPDVLNEGDLDVFKEINSTLFHRLLFRYFNPGCSSVFIAGLPLRNFVPPLPDFNDQAGANRSFPFAGIRNRTKAPSNAAQYYPDCYCRDDGRGFVCNKQYTEPPTKQLVTRDYILDVSGDNMNNYLLYTQPQFRLHRYGGLEFGLKVESVPEDFGYKMPAVVRRLAVRRVSKAWFNHKGYHSIPIYLNAMNNAILRANLMRNTSSQPLRPATYGITLINHPFNNTEGNFDLEFTKSGGDAIVALFIIIAMSFVPASFILFLVQERSNGSKHLQFLAGMHPVVYWITNFVWDMCNYSFPMMCIFVILKAFDLPAYISSTNFPATFALFLFYGWSITAMMYPASFYFTEPSGAYIFLIVANLFTGITCILTSAVMELFSDYHDLFGEANYVLKMLFMIFPNYCLGRGLIDLASTEQKNELFILIGQRDKVQSPFEMDVTLRNMIAMAVEGLVFFLVTLAFEYGFRLRKKLAAKPLPRRLSSSLGSEDTDVLSERHRVLNGLTRDSLLKVVSLTKVYRSRKLGDQLAVNRLCFSVPRGECFGLLGVNGAGKTSTFRMLTGDMKPTYGDVYFNGRNIRSAGVLQKNIGYCPQFDALFDELTGREHLRMYARIRGVVGRHIDVVCDSMISRLNLSRYADRPVRTYSGGNRRKLAIAIALIGDPVLIFLDEPTTGMDPFSRRFLWDVIASLVEAGRSVVLTSHSMEECEVLCSRLAIMVNGTFRCLGSIQHLKTRFGEGYSIKLRYSSADALDANLATTMAIFQSRLSNVALKERHNNVAHLEVSSRQMRLSNVFGALHTLMQRADMHIVDFSVSQKSLESVFLSFTKLQRDSPAATDEDGQIALTSSPSQTASVVAGQDSFASDDALLYEFAEEHVEDHPLVVG